MGASMPLDGLYKGGSFLVALLLLVVAWQVNVAMGLLHGRAAAIAVATGAHIS